MSTTIRCSAFKFNIFFGFLLVRFGIYKGIWFSSRNLAIVLWLDIYYKIKRVNNSFILFLIFMKRIYSFLIALVVCIITFGAILYFNKPTVIAPTNPEDVIPYAGELVVAGIGPVTSFEESVGEDVLVLRQNFEDHTDHVFLNKTFWDSYLDSNEDVLPGNIVSFEGDVIALDAAAGNHYYEVVSIQNLTKTRNATKEEVETILKSYNYCEQDSDCATTYGKCPLECWIAVNTKFLDVSHQIIDQYRNTQENQCEYKCMEMSPVTCENSVCVFSWNLVSDPDIPSSGNEVAYEEVMESFWVWPEVSFEAGINETDLVIKKTFEDHSDHIFIAKDLRSLYLSEEDTLPGNSISFKGEIIGIDAGAGNHYYKVASVEKLEKVWSPTQEEVNEILERFNYCEQDSDCVDYYAECPFGCARGTNGKFLEISQQIIDQYRNTQDELCVYGCVATKGVSCKDFRCVVELELAQ